MKGAEWETQGQDAIHPLINTQASRDSAQSFESKMLSEHALHHTSTTWVSGARSYLPRAQRDRLPQFSRETRTHSRSGAGRSGSPATKTRAQHVHAHLRRESNGSRTDTQLFTSTREAHGQPLGNTPDQDTLVRPHQQPKTPEHLGKFGIRHGTWSLGEAERSCTDTHRRVGTLEVYPGGETLVLALVPVDIDEGQGPVGAHLRTDLHAAQVRAAVFCHQARPHSGACKGRETALKVAGRGGRQGDRECGAWHAPWQPGMYGRGVHTLR